MILFIYYFKIKGLFIFFHNTNNVRKKILYSYLYFNQSNLFYNQYDFRPKHSTNYAALELIYIIINSMDNNDVSINIFIDLSKAFDINDHNMLLNKLRHYGLDGSTLLLLENYLSNQK